MRPPSDSRPWRRETSALLRLAGPVILAQLGMLAMGLVDTLMVGRVSESALAAVAVGHLYSFTVLGTAFGLLGALDPVLAQALGAGDEEAAARGLQRGLLLSVVLVPPAAAAMLVAEPVLRALGQSDTVVPVAAEYVRVSIGSALPFFAFIAFRQALQARHRVAPVVLAVVVANVANVGLNWMLVFGRGGFPALGPVGCAWATVVVRWLMAAVVLLAAWPELRGWLRPFRPEALRWRPAWRLFKLGFPLGLQHFLEISTFAAVALLMGWIGVTELAGHQIALQLASTTFMIPLGIASAAAVRVGRAVGAEDPAGARRAALVSLGAGAFVMAASALTFATVPEPLARSFTPDTGVIAVAVVLVRIAAVFQVFDGLQVVAVGILRGLGDTRTPLIVNVVGFWGVGLPLGFVLAFRRGLGAAGLWWGLCAGLLAVAIILLVRVRHRLSGRLVRVDVESDAST